MNKNNTNAVPLNTTTFNTRLLNTTKLNTIGFPVLSKRSGSSADISQAITDSLVCWYDPGKQQCTNESMAANPVLADLSGNGHDIECFNFGWAGMSGIGGYEVEYDKAGGIYSTVNGNIVTVDGTALDKLSWFWSTNAPYSGKPFKVNVTVEIADSNTDADKCLIFQRTNGTFSYRCKQGYNEVPAIYGTGNLQFSLFGKSKVLIEFLPEYPNALVSDGVDDYCYTDGLPILTDYTVIAKRKILADTVSALASKASNNDSTDGAFIFDAKNGDGYIACNFGANNALDELYSGDISYQTKESYNGNSIIKLNHVDTDKLSLFTFSAQKNLINQYALYSFLLFDRTLTTAEIEWVKKNMIESGGG